MFFGGEEMSDDVFDFGKVFVFGFFVAAIIVVLLGYFFAIVPLQERIDPLEERVSFIENLDFDTITICDENTSECTSFSAKERVVDLSIVSNFFDSALINHNGRIEALENSVSNNTEKLVIIESFLNGLIEFLNLTGDST